MEIGLQGDVSSTSSYIDILGSYRDALQGTQTQVFKMLHYHSSIHWNIMWMDLLYLKGMSLHEFQKISIEDVTHTSNVRRSIRNNQFCSSSFKVVDDNRCGCQGLDVTPHAPQTGEGCHGMKINCYNSGLFLLFWGTYILVEFLRQD